MRIYKPVRNKEVWLEFGSQWKDGFQDMVWYNEGNNTFGEWRYFLTHLLRDLFKKDMYYLARLPFGVIYFKGYDKHQ